MMSLRNINYNSIKNWKLISFQMEKEISCTIEPRHQNRNKNVNKASDVHRNSLDYYFNNGINIFIDQFFCRNHTCAFVYTNSLMHLTHDTRNMSPLLEDIGNTDLCCWTLQNHEFAAGHDLVSSKMSSKINF
jgi:hypothetical protein